MNTTENIDLALLRDSGWFASSVEVHSGAGTGPGAVAYSVRTPLTELLEREAMEEDGSVEYLEQRKRWMVEGAVLIIREALGSSSRLDLVDTGLTIAVWAWDIGLPPLDEMSQEAIGELAAQTRAAICARHKIKAERKKIKAGAKATKTMRQKPAAMVEIYQYRARGNRNRAREGMSEALRKVG